LIYCAGMDFSNELPEKLQLDPNLRYFEGRDARKIFMRNTVSGHAVLFRKQMLPLITPFKEGVWYDWMMAVTAAYNGGVQFYNEALVLHREHSDSMTLGSELTLSAKEQEFYKKEVIAHCNAFQHVPNIPGAHKQFAAQFSFLLQRSLSKKFYFPLFSFIFKNRKLLFNYKKKVAFFSHLKHSFRRTIN
jgi:hypothetical protein